MPMQTRPALDAANAARQTPIFIYRMLILRREAGQAIPRAPVNRYRRSASGCRKQTSRRNIVRRLLQWIVGDDDGLPSLLPPLDHLLLDVADRLGRVQPLGAGIGAVHNGVAAIELERVFELVEALAGLFVAAVLEPSRRLEQHRRTEIALALPPIARAGRGAAEAQN